MKSLAHIAAVVAAVAVAGCGDSKTAEVDPEAPPVSPTTTTPAPQEPQVTRRPMLGVGAVAPNFTREAHDGRTIELAKIGGPVILYFYHKDETPG